MADNKTFVMIHDHVNPKTGKTYKEENLEKKHNLPIGSLVELEWNKWHGEGACWNMKARLWVVLQTRDCDGTPLYSLNRYRTGGGDTFHGFTEEDLTLIKQTDSVLSGIFVPKWLIEE